MPTRTRIDLLFATLVVLYVVSLFVRVRWDEKKLWSLKRSAIFTISAWAVLYAVGAFFSRTFNPAQWNPIDNGVIVIFALIMVPFLKKGRPGERV